MTIEEMKTALQEKITQGIADVESKRAALRQAELDLMHLQGQLYILSQFRKDKDESS